MREAIRGRGWKGSEPPSRANCDPPSPTVPWREDRHLKYLPPGLSGLPWMASAKGLPSMSCSPERGSRSTYLEKKGEVGSACVS